jgi:hypothetical protein
VRIENIELSKDMGFAYPPSIPPSGARVLRVLAAAVSSALKISSHTPVGNPRAPHQLGVLRRSVKRPKLTSLASRRGDGLGGLGRFDWAAQTGQMRQPSWILRAQFGQTLMPEPAMRMSLRCRL